MQTRRDQLHAYRYVIRRIMTALLGAEPEAPEQPIRRVVTATFSGILVAVVAAGIVALVAFLTKSGAQAWQQPLSLVVEKETGARWLNIDNVLHPINNYTSARLLASGDVSIVRASRDDLAAAEFGAAVGIPGAPDALPEADAVLSAPWTICTSQEGTGGAATHPVDVFVGQERSDFDAAALGDQALVLTDAGTGELFLLWRGMRFHTTADALVSVGRSGADRVPVASTWLNAVPEGPDFAPMTIEGRGEQAAPTGTSLDQVLIGGVVRDVQNDTYYVRTSDGRLTPVKPTEAALLTGSGLARQTDLPPAEIIPHVAQTGLSAEELPEQVPDVAPVPAGTAPAVCVWYEREGTGSGTAGVTVGGSLPEGTEPAATGRITATTADRVTVPSGQVAVVATGAPGGAAPTAFGLVTDNGVLYPVPSQEVLGYLGFGEVEPLPLPGLVADLVPRGPALDPQAAARGEVLSPGAAAGSVPG